MAGDGVTSQPRATHGPPSPIRYVIDPHGPEVIGMVADHTLGGANQPGLEELPREEALTLHEEAMLDWDARLLALMASVQPRQPLRVVQ